jgi:hypothetical protein
MRARWWLVIAGLTLLPACAPSEADIRNEFAAYVAGANACQADADCALAYGRCPLGCWVAVRADRKNDVEAKARELVEDYSRGGQSCEYDCAVAGPVTCVAARCFVQAEGLTPAAAAKAGPPGPDAR